MGIQQQNGFSFGEITDESMYELLNFSVDTTSTNVTPTQAQHQPQLDNISYIKMTSVHDTNISDQVNDLQQQPSTSISPFVPISDNSHQPQFNPKNHMLMESHQDANILNQQYQFNIPNATLVDAGVNFMGNNSNQNLQTNEQNNQNETFLNQTIDVASQIDNEADTVNDDDIILDSFSSMSISSGPILDSKFASEMCSDFIKHLDNNGGETMVSNDNHSYLHSHILMNIT